MQTPTRTSEEYEAQKRLIAATMLAIRSQWGRMGGDWWSSFESVGPRMGAVLTAGQVASARQGAAYVPEVLDEQGMSPAPVGRVRPEAFAGRAADGRPMSSLLGMAVVRAKGAGSLESGMSFLDSVVQTEIADAHRASIQVATIARPGTGYVRMVNSPCCKDCAVLAGKWFKANEGFLRHPNCKCFHLPTTDPAAYEGRMPEPHEITGLSEGERKALEDGGDYSQVINASRGASKNKMSTTEGTTRRGVAYSAMGGNTRSDVRRPGERYRRTTRRRITPDGIYKVASTPEEARRLLTANGYILPSVPLTRR